ncbi:Dynein light chain 1, cytoplasmic [Cryptosporidium felis]|nr:Dynein light chain 1, cytoplasmic [Cryptosporidium felis]
MSDEMQQDAIACAAAALERHNVEKDIAAYIKKEFDRKYNPTWHCVVGRNFGSYNQGAEKRIGSDQSYDDLLWEKCTIGLKNK